MLSLNVFKNISCMSFKDDQHLLSAHFYTLLLQHLFFIPNFKLKKINTNKINLLDLFQNLRNYMMQIKMLEILTF